MERYLRRQLRSGEVSLDGLGSHYGLRPPRGLAALPQLDIPEHQLSSHDELLGGAPEQASPGECPALTPETVEIGPICSQWQAAEQQATADGWSPASYLYVLAEQEHQQRPQARLRWLLHEAQLPVPKTLADYDWAVLPDLDRHQIEHLAHDTTWVGAPVAPDGRRQPRKRLSHRLTL